MLYRVRQATLEDIEKIEEISRLSFNKLELSKEGLNYNVESTTKRLISFVNGVEYRSLVCINVDSNIVGFVIAAVFPTLYDDDVDQIVEIGMHSDPRLNKVNQAKILLVLMNAIEKVSLEENINIVSSSICPKFDIGYHLEHKGYLLSNKIYSKERVF